MSAEEVDSLEILASLVMDEMELRLAVRETVFVETQLRREAEQLADALQASLLPPRPPALPGVELATRYDSGERGLEVGGDFYDVFHLGGSDWGLVLGDAFGQGGQGGGSRRAGPLDGASLGGAPAEAQRRPV